MSLILHCGAAQATREQVEAVPVPRHTRTWKPVAYGKSIELMHRLAEQQLKLPVVGEQYGLNKAGDQMFGLLTLDTGNAEHGMSIGLRNSYNKTLSNGVAVGAQVFVCDNLCFSGSAFKVLRRNTTNVWADFRQLVEAQIRRAYGHYEAIEKNIEAMKNVRCNVKRGYEHLGVMIGTGLLTPTQANVAFGDWKRPRHEAFRPRTVWSLYNAITEGLKKGAPALTLDRHARAHDYLQQLAA